MLDGRTRQAKLMAQIRRDLTAHLGGSPSATQRMVVDRLARVCLRLELFDEKLAGGTMTDHDARAYGALHNSFRLLLRELGMKAAPKPAPTLAEILARPAAQATAP